MTEVTEIADIAARASSTQAALAQAGHRGRVALLNRLAEAFDRDAAELAAIAQAETGLGEVRLRGEAARTAAQFRLMAEVLIDGGPLNIVIDHRRGADEPGGPRPELRRTATAIGVVAVFAASNFPLAFGVAGTDTAAAFAAGCPVIAKSHRLQPRTALLCAKIVHETLKYLDLPLDLFQVIAGQDAGRALVQAGPVKAAAFTGSTTGGRALWDLACARPDPIPFYGELGGINPVVVTPAAARHAGAELGAALAASALLGHGQFCTQPGLILVPSDSADELRFAIAAAVGTYKSPQLIGQNLAASYRDGLARLAGIPEARLVAAGDAAGDGPSDVQAQLWEIAGTAAIDRVDELASEIFGPQVTLVTYRDETELLRLVAAIEGSLTFSIHSDPEDDALTRALYEIARGRTGRILGAGVPTGVAVTWAQHHGGPWPGTTQALHTSVGAGSITRFLRPIAYQDAPAEYLPQELDDENSLGLTRRVDGVLVAGARPTGAAS